MRYDALRPQKLAAPVRVLVEQFSAHPLEADRSELYAAPDGYVDSEGKFHRHRQADSDRPVYEIELLPEDGLYPLPYMARQASGLPWDSDSVAPDASAEGSRQTFYPDGARTFDEIDRFGISKDGTAGALSAEADVSFFRILPPAGYTKGLPQEKRTDVGDGDIKPETRGRQFFPYRPRHLSARPPRPALAKLTNHVTQIMSSGKFDAAIWTQGSPNIEETVYWLSLLIDTTLPIACNAAQRPHGEVGHDGPRNILDSLTYFKSRIWEDLDGRNRFGTVLIQDQQIIAGREAAKADARPGGFVATGGMGGVIAQITGEGATKALYAPLYKHTFCSEVRLTALPYEANAISFLNKRLVASPMRIRDDEGYLTEAAIPSVSIVKDGGYCELDWTGDPSAERDLIATIEHKLSLGLLTGLVYEGTAPAGNAPSPARLGLLVRAAFSGIPVVRAGRGSHEGFADTHPFLIGGSNLTATKARILLMASLMKFGSLPAAGDPDSPTRPERDRLTATVAKYQSIFDTH
ncbi:MAG: asparaginase domain-containing protein [Beijerinckiaceae bacterium]